MNENFIDATIYQNIYGELYGLKRSSSWDKFRDKLIIERGSRCELSGTTTDLEAHHILPFHICILMGWPHLEMDPNNIIILSQSPIPYHLLIGHLGSFESFNPHIFNLKLWQKVIKGDITKDVKWLNAKVKRPKPFREMNNKDKGYLKKFMKKVSSL